MQISVVFEPYKLIFNYNVKNSVMICTNINNGPIGRPIAIDSIESAVKIYGSPADGIVKTAYYSGITRPNIFMTRLNGIPASCTINGIINGRLTPLIRLYDANNGAANNGSMCAYIDQANNKICMLDPATGVITKEYDFRSYQTIGNLVDKINTDASYYSINYVADSLFDLSTFINPSVFNIANIPQRESIKYYLNGGIDDDFEINELSTKYSLYNYPVSTYALDGYYYGEEGHIEQIKKFTELCYTQNALGNPVIGVIGCKPKTEEQTLDEYIDMLDDFQQRTTDLFKNNYDDAGAYMFVVCGDLAGFGDDGIYEYRPAVSIASMLSTLDRNQPLINKKIKNVTDDFMHFNQYQINRLVTMKINPIVKTLSGHYGLLSSVTRYGDYASEKELFDSLMVTRIGQEIVYRLSQEFETQPGNNMSMIALRTIDSKLDNILHQLIEEDYLKDYSYEVIQQGNEVYLKVSYIPVSEIEFVNVLVRI